MHIYMQNGGGIHSQTTPSLAAKDAEIARLRAEVEGLRTTLEIIAVGDSRTPHIDAAQALLRSGYWTDEIDAAMGEPA